VQRRRGKKEGEERRGKDRRGIEEGIKHRITKR
jgi:hypothetical protein